MNPAPLKQAIPLPVQGDTVLFLGIDSLERAAVVTKVHSKFVVNLHVFRVGVTDNIHGSYDEVTHCGPETHEEPVCGPSWRWPPSRLQKGVQP